MIILGIVLCIVSAIFCAIALAGARRGAEKETSVALILAPSIVLFAVLPIFLFKRVLREWPDLSIYSVSILISIAAAISAAAVLAPVLAR